MSLLPSVGGQGLFCILLQIAYVFVPILELFFKQKQKDETTKVTPEHGLLLRPILVEGEREIIKEPSGNHTLVGNTACTCFKLFQWLSC